MVGISDTFALHQLQAGMFKHEIVKYRVVYDRKNQAETKGKALIQIEAYQDGNRRYFSTGIHISPDQWNKKRNEPKDPYLANQVRSAISYYQNMEQNARYNNQGAFSLRDFSMPNIAEASEPVAQTSQTFNEFFAEQIKARDKELKWNTYRQQIACLNLLNEYNPSIAFEDLKFKLIDSLHQFMVNKGHCNSTSGKRHKIIRSYIAKAIKMDIIVKNPYDTFRIPAPVVNKIALLGSELRDLENLQFSEPHGRLERVRDMYLFATYTGLRWSDVSKVTRQNLISTEEGLVLNVKASKTEKVFQLPLWLTFEGKGQEIARKYWPYNESEKLFPRLNNAFANRALKRLALLAGIKKHLHFHSSRHTAGTILAKTAGVLTAKDVLQHATLATTMGYLHLSNAERNKSLEEVQKWY